jgi:hypothetical protein
MIAGLLTLTKRGFAMRWVVPSRVPKPNQNKTIKNKTNPLADPSFLYFNNWNISLTTGTVEVLAGGTERTSTFGDFHIQDRGGSYALRTHSCTLLKLGH